MTLVLMGAVLIAGALLLLREVRAPPLAASLLLVLMLIILMLLLFAAASVAEVSSRVSTPEALALRPDLTVSTKQGTNRQRTLLL